MISVLRVSTGDCSLSCCIVGVKLAWAWLWLESQSYTLPVGSSANTVQRTTSHRKYVVRYMLSYTGLAWQICLVVAWLGLASVRLYYTAPYRFSVSMFRAPVLSTHTRLAWLGSVRQTGWVGLGSASIYIHIARAIRYQTQWYRHIPLYRRRKDVLLVEQGTTLVLQ